MTAADEHSTAPLDTDVLIVGAGPTGLTAAIRLAQRGVALRILDAAPHPVDESRAALVHAATIEIMDRLGVADEAIRLGRRIDAVSISAGPRVLARVPFDVLDGPYPFALGLPQDLTERLLIARLTELGVTVERGWRVEQVDQGTAGCRVVATGDGASRTIRSRYLIGADGHDSAVRAGAGIPFTARRYRADFLLADLPLDPPPSPADQARITLSPDGVTVFGALPSGNHRVIGTASPGDEVPPHPDAAYLDALFAAREIPTRAAAEPAWSSRFRISHGVAARLRSGAIFLCGDAAHVHSPAAGQGMNTGIADAYDLAERLADALDGRTDALDGYEPARLAAAEEVVRLTDRITRLALIRPAPLRWIRNAVLSRAMTVAAVQRRLAGWISGLERSPLR
ncbi:FAD-dependent oxidoreductase [Agromyces larvae]|uniref:FAD-dependent monooxygenase n=1 Tax=Agromyces larvae TaxID=2929802 RepID=A0ABY4BUC3_9MICO|nr:FAD-dependent monooxygenase [Agromyces larvae]UOE42802.1 FAD-dependent monooxygenase [Agromyces larvae]